MSAQARRPKTAGASLSEPVGAEEPAEQLRVGERLVTITHPNRVVFPQLGVTKLDVALYYQRVGEAALRGPSLGDRCS